MVLVYCEFQPAPHRNKRPATLIFLDDPNDKFPMPICSVCAQVIKKQQPNAVIRDRQEFEKERMDKRKAVAKAKVAAARAAQGAAEGGAAKDAGPSGAEGSPSPDAGAAESDDDAAAP
ncbi:MAG: hypothetical protein ACYDDF_09925 [Thermoplasmatota archaeon]